MTTLISTWVGVGGGALFGSLWQPPSHKSTLAEMKGGEDPVENKRIERRKWKRARWIDKCRKTVRFPPFQMHADTPGNVFTLNKGVWWVGKSLSFPMQFTWRNTSCLFGFKWFGERKYAVLFPFISLLKQFFFFFSKQVSKSLLFQQWTMNESSGHYFFSFVNVSFSFHLLSRYWNLRKWLKQVEISIFPIYFRCLK